MAMDNLATPLAGNDAKSLEKLESWKKYVFFITFMNYAMSHFSRKCYTNVKMNLQAAGLSTVLLSQMDTGFMFTYAFGSFISGKLGDTYPQNVVVGVGLIGSTFVLGCITFFVDLNIINTNYVAGFSLFLGAQLIHGLFQSTGGPVNTAIMGNWFPKKGRGLIFGLWTCHQYTGDIVAALATAMMISWGWAWQWALLVPAIANGAWAIVNFYFLPNAPIDAGIVTEEMRLKADQKAEAQKAGEEVADGISFAQAASIPNVASYAAAFGFFKLVNYAMFFWLPFFLAIHFSANSANVISSLYSFGMMPGGVIVGFVSDLYNGRRACVIATFMVLLCPLLWMFAMYSDTMPPVLLLVLLGCMGILVGGPNNIISSAVAADLADHPSLKGNSRALGTVTGLINGSGSVTAALGLMAIGPIEAAFGWTGVWYFLIICTAAGTGLMGPKIYKEMFYHDVPDYTAAPSK